MYLRTVTVFLGIVLATAAALPNAKPASTKLKSTSTTLSSTSSTLSSTSTTRPSTSTTLTSTSTKLMSTSTTLTSTSTSTTLTSTSTSSTTCGAATTACFDTLPTLAAAAVAPIGLYEGLYFNLDELTTGLPEAGVPLLTGVVAQSTPNVAAYNNITTAVSGTPSITTLQTGTSFKNFILNSLYFGCAASTEAGQAGVPLSCTVSAVALRNGVQIAQQYFTYPVPLGSTRVPMQLVTLNGFTNVDTVTFTTAVGTGVAVLFDNMVFQGCQ